MRLLITIQAVDAEDPVLGVFVRWIEELARRFERVHVICLKAGAYRLPENVSVHSLGKEGGRSRIKYLMRFYRFIFSLRKEYDVVFVHMNSEYAVLGGLFWRAWRKRIVLWRNHKMPGLSTWIAAHLSHAVCYTSPASYVAGFSNAVRMPIGVDTDLFSPVGIAPSNSILFFGRLDEIKRPHIFIEALEWLRQRGISFSADIVGDPTDATSSYIHALRNQAKSLALENVLTLCPALPHAQSPDLFRTHAIYVNLTPSGSFDKTIGEAAACGCIVVAANEVLRGIVPDALVVDQLSSEDVARGIEAAIAMPADQRSLLSEKLRAYVMREQSLMLLIDKLFPILAA